MATRRVEGMGVDHGARYLDRHRDQEASFQTWVETLLQAELLQPWLEVVYEMDLQVPAPRVRSPAVEKIYPRYVPRTGMSAIAKFLAQNLEVRLQQQVVQLQPLGEGWQLQLAGGNLAASAIAVGVVVLAIPAPQALALCEPLGLPAEFLAALGAVEFAPCLSAIAGYPSRTFEDLADLPAAAIACGNDPILEWISLETSKRGLSAPLVFVLQSTAAFAREFLEQPDLDVAAAAMLAQGRSLLPWLVEPEWLQIHRWRYAFVERPYPDPYLRPSNRRSLLCCGDWCGGDTIPAAFRSGLAAAAAIVNSR